MPAIDERLRRSEPATRPRGEVVDECGYQDGADQHRIEQHAERNGHPPVYYVPIEDVRPGVLVPSGRTSFCEFKGGARYHTVQAGGRIEKDAAWYYPRPSPGFEAIADHVAFYPGRMDECNVDDERVKP